MSPGMIFSSNTFQVTDIALDVHGKWISSFLIIIILFPALVKSIGLRSDGRLDERSYWVTRATSISVPLAAPLVYPRLFAVHSLAAKVWTSSRPVIWPYSLSPCMNQLQLIWQDDDGSVIPPTVPLSSEHIADDGIYLLENGEDALIYVGNSVKSEILQQIFGAPSVDGILTQVYYLSLFYLFSSNLCPHLCNI